MQGSDQRCRGAIRGGEERSEVEESSQRWRGTLKVGGSSQSWRGAVRGGGERSEMELEGSDQSLRWRGAMRGGGK